MNYQLIGDATQSLLLNLEAGEEVRAEAAYLIACNEAISMETPSALAAFNPNEPFFEDAPLATFRCLSPGGMLVLGAATAGKVNALDIAGSSWLCARDALLGTTQYVEVTRAQQQKIGGGALGNEGFTLRKLSGAGTAFLHVGGALFESTLENGQHLRVDPACLCAFEEGVSLEPHFVGGFRNSLFGGEGVHLLQIGGTGRVLLQTLPLARLAARVLVSSGVQSAAAPAASGAFREIGGVFPPE